MAIYKIVELGNEVLREPAKKVPRITKSIIKLLYNMTDTLRHSQGVGLAAPQIGVSKQVVVIDLGEGILEMINPEIIEFEGQSTDNEGCLSMTGTMGEVTRAEIIKVKFLDRNGQEHVLQADGLLARAVQHEVDHLNGVLIIDIAEKVWQIKQEE
ncbi:MAG: peptide deformylase [Peptococcaceae bacterium]|nr:peptide deformylase [Peptococcaceae bacterium]